MAPHMSVIVKPGPITDLPVDTIVSSSNSLLILGSGTAGQVKRAGGNIPPGTEEFDDYFKLVSQAKSPLSLVLQFVHSREPEPSIVQKECLRILIRRDPQELKLGDAVMTSPGILAQQPERARKIIHAVGMTYDYKVQPNPPVIPATKQTVWLALANSFELANSIGCKSLAVPVMCTRKGGLTKEESTEATLDALFILEERDSSVKELYISLYDDDLQKEEAWFAEAYRRRRVI